MFDYILLYFLSVWALVWIFFSEFELSSLFLFSAMYYEFGWIKKCPEDPSVTVHA